MLAADHRWQWEEFCEARSIPRELIRDVKRVAYDGFLRARERSAAAHEFGALVIDEQNSSAAIADALKARLTSGFAIGRSVFWEPSASFLEGRTSADDAAAAIASTYLALVEAWNVSRKI